LQGTVGSAPAIERKKGFEAVLSLFPDMKIVKSQSGDFTTSGGKDVMESFIKATNGLKARPADKTASSRGTGRRSRPRESATRQDG
jgi:ABC-type sugar transport system substrate-binding protein